MLRIFFYNKNRLLHETPDIFIVIHLLNFRAIDVCPQIKILTYLKSRTKNARIRNEFAQSLMG